MQTPRRRPKRAPRWLSRSVAATAVGATLLTGLGVHAAHASGGLTISEVAPWASGSSPYMSDWFELTNNSASAVSISGWKVDDNSNAFASSVPMSGVTAIPAGGSAVFMEVSGTQTASGQTAAFISYWFGASAPSGFLIGTYSGTGVGLGTGGDAVNVYDSSGALKANVVFGASPSSAPFATFDNAAGIDNGTISTLSAAGTDGAYQVSTSPSAIGSPGAATATGATTTTTSGTTTTTTAATTTPTNPNQPWPGGSTLDVVDNADLTTGNLSGLSYEASGTSAPGTMWAVQNKLGVLFKLQYDALSGKWVSAPGEWANGKKLYYAAPDASRDPDAEGVTMGGPTSASGIYVGTERDNTNSGTSKNAVLKYDVSAAGTSLNAVKEWDLTADLPVNGANLGIETVTWMPDSFLVAKGLKDANTGLAYDPSQYGDHNNGLFVVGIEASGQMYGYVLRNDGTFKKITTFASGFTGVMASEFDADTGLFWSHCDAACGDPSAILKISPATGTFAPIATYDRPAAMPATQDNEGYAIAPDAECANGVKPVYWADDGDSGGNSLRRGTLTCQASISPAVPEFPVLASQLLVVLAFAGSGAVLVRLRRRRAV